MDGEIEYTCIVCKNTYIEVTEAPGHDYECEIIREATEEVEGLAEYTCTVCGDKYTEYIPVIINPFEDVVSGEFYYKAVLWAYDNGITMGFTETTFCPYLGCTRAQIVTFLYRAAGEPEVEEVPDIPFTDVDMSPKSSYADALIWAYATGITDGTTLTTFSPDTVCTRAQIITFLYRAAGEPDVDLDEEIKFRDVDLEGDSFYKEAIHWVIDEGITNGYSDYTFAPDDDCTRGQIVTFLYRYYVGE